MSSLKIIQLFATFQTITVNLRVEHTIFKLIEASEPLIKII